MKLQVTLHFLSRAENNELIQVCLHTACFPSITQTRVPCLGKGLPALINVIKIIPPQMCPPHRPTWSKQSLTRDSSQLIIDYAKLTKLSVRQADFCELQASPGDIVLLPIHNETLSQKTKITETMQHIWMHVLSFLLLCLDSLRQRPRLLNVSIGPDWHDWHALFHMCICTVCLWPILRVGSAVKNIFCSCRRPWFNSQNPNGGFCL